MKIQTLTPKDVVDVLWQALKESAYSNNSPEHLEARKAIEEQERKEAAVADFECRWKSWGEEIKADKENKQPK